MIIISTRILGNYFFTVASQHAEYFSDKKGYNKEEIANKLNVSKDLNEFKKNYESYFGDDIKLDIVSSDKN